MILAVAFWLTSGGDVTLLGGIVCFDPKVFVGMFLDEK